MAATGFRLKVRVEDAHQHHPVNAMVRVSRVGSADKDWSLSLHSGSDGIVSIDKLKQGHYIVSVESAPVTYALPVSFEGRLSANRTVRFLMQRAAGVEVSVTTSKSSRAVQVIQTRNHRMELIALQRSADGKFRFDRLDPTARTAVIAGAAGAHQCGQAGLVMKPGEVAKLDLAPHEIDPLKLSIQGRVTLKGVPSPGLIVRAVELRAAGYPVTIATVRTDDSGLYSICDLPAGSYQLSVYRSAKKKTKAVTVPPYGSLTVDFKH